METTTTPAISNGGARDRTADVAPIAALKAPPATPIQRREATWKRWLVFALAAVFVVGAFAAYRFLASSGHAVRYRVVPVGRGPLSASVSATGNLNAVTTVLVGSQVSGTIKELHADFNTVVRTGQVIARIDPALFEAAVSQARADLKSAHSTVLNREAQVEQAVTSVDNARADSAEAEAQTAKALVTVVDTRRTLARHTELFESGLVAAADRDSAQTAYDAAIAQHESAQAHARALASAIRTAEAQLRVQQAELQVTRDQVEQKEAALTQAQINLDHTTIRSPVDGVVVNRAVDVGQTVAATLQAPTLFTIAQDLTRMQVETSVDEADIARIRTDTPVTFTVDAFPGETFAGRVSQIRKAPQVAQNVVTYIVVVAVANPSGTLVPGMTANVKFVTAQKDNVLKIPNTALRFRPPGALLPMPESASSSMAQPGRPDTNKRQATTRSGEGIVWILGADGGPVPVRLTLGITDGTFTEILGGDLRPGQAVVVALEGQAPVAAPGTAPPLRF
ncbi:MAG TPA: efflux RND transporter periplasmic adaptor subunit [Methylomirabilota bacterium]|nr:efflux RND transporter periplasmic adaptor subunit [Methylomirabilota bacterium]